MVNPKKVLDIANKIERIIKNPGLSRVLVTKGKQKLNQWKEKDFIKVIRDLLDEFYLDNYKLRKYTSERKTFG